MLDREKDMRKERDDRIERAKLGGRCKWYGTTAKGREKKGKKKEKAAVIKFARRVTLS